MRDLVGIFTDARPPGPTSAYHFFGWHAASNSFAAPDTTIDGKPVVFGRLSIGRVNRFSDYRAEGSTRMADTRQYELSIELNMPVTNIDISDDVFDTVLGFLDSNHPTGYTIRVQDFEPPSEDDIAPGLFANFATVRGVLPLISTVS